MTTTTTMMMMVSLWGNILSSGMPCCYWDSAWNGWLEFAGVENDGPSKNRAVEFAGLENDGLKNDGVEQEQTYILHPMKNFNVYDM